MTQREARWTAMLVIAEEVNRLVDVSDEWMRHPETDAQLDPDDVYKIKSQARRWAKKAAMHATAQLAAKKERT